ncbi:MAG TPA: MFS transporter [Prolixibacteraceae bacterium]|jgi:PAT family beta-lactamase induction signal transducer AmpG|nr:MFS transporter [Prolixibacteraceae bacterium]
MSNIEKSSLSKQRNPWAWIPTLYFAEGIPNVVAMTVSLIMFKRMGISNADITFYTGWLYLPWVIKPFWSPLVDLLKTKRWWIIIMQLFIGAALGGVALALPLPGYFQITMIFLWLLAFSSATHDISADGFYMLGLNEHQQTYFVGIRSTFYRMAMITGQGLLIILVGFFETATGLAPIEINVKAQTNISKQITLPEINQTSTPSGDSFFATFPDEIIISTKNIQKQQLDSIRQLVKAHNLSLGFVHNTKQLASQKNVNSDSWWTSYISSPLKHFLQRHFQNKEILQGENTSIGNVAVVAVKLNGKPEADKEMVLNVKWQKGDQSLQLIEGERLAFTLQNWEQPAYILVQADPKLTRETETIFKGTSGNIHLAWSMTFVLLAVMFVLFSFYHRFILPYPASDKKRTNENLFKAFFKTFTSFFQKKEIWVILSFLMFYRLGEAQLVKMASPFMLDPRQLGGLGLTTGDVGLIYGTFGILALTAGGILGGLAAAKKGFRFWLWWMVLAINIPHLAYVYMAFAQPTNYLVISLCAAIEQFSYGFGFTAYMLYMIYISEGEHKTAHFAIATGFMALGMMLPGMLSGWLQEIIGYKYFFVWIMLCMIPAMIPIFFVKVKPGFGIKEK